MTDIGHGCVVIDFQWSRNLLSRPPESILLDGILKSGVDDNFRCRDIVVDRVISMGGTNITRENWICWRFLIVLGTVIAVGDWEPTSASLKEVFPFVKNLFLYNNCFHVDSVILWPYKSWDLLLVVCFIVLFDKFETEYGSFARAFYFQMLKANWRFECLDCIVFGFSVMVSCLR